MDPKYQADENAGSSEANKKVEASKANYLKDTAVVDNQRVTLGAAGSNGTKDGVETAYLDPKGSSHKGQDSDKI